MATLAAQLHQFGVCRTQPKQINAHICIATPTARQSRRSTSFRALSISERQLSSSAPSSTTLRVERSLGDRRCGKAFSCVASTSSSTEVIDTRRAGETKEQKVHRRAQETLQVHDRVIDVHTKPDLEDQLHEARDKLVVLQVTTASDRENEQATYAQAKETGQMQSIVQNSKLKHLLSRTVRECPDVVFLSLAADESTEAEEARQWQEIGLLPTLQFIRRGEVLLSHTGRQHVEPTVTNALSALTPSLGASKEDLNKVAQVSNKGELEQFLADAGSKLAVVEVSMESEQTCENLFPATLALSKALSDSGLISFGRILLPKKTPPQEAGLGEELGVSECPSYLIYKDGVELERHRCTSRGQLIGHILNLMPRPCTCKNGAVAKTSEVKKSQKMWGK